MTIPDGYLEVRCCCQPQKVLGYLPHGGAPAAGEHRSWMVHPGGVRWRVRRYTEAIPPSGSPIEFETIPPDVLRLQIREWCLWSWTTASGGLAFYSEETPLERLRQVPGFIEHPPVSPK